MNSDHITTREPTQMEPPVFRPNPIPSSLIPTPEALIGGSGSTPPQKQKKPPTSTMVASTITEALQDLLERQEQLKRDLDVLISDATTLRLQM